MRSHWCALSLAVPAVALSLLLATSSVDASLVVDDALPVDRLPAKRDDHHHHMGAPLAELNETEVTLHHAPIPPSWYTLDFENDPATEHQYPGLMFMHVVIMCLAFFGALPAGIIMRSVKHSWHGAVMVVFYGLSALGCASVALYKKLTPNMYEGSVHGRQSYLILAITLVLTCIDLLNVFRRIVSFFQGGNRFVLRAFWNAAILGKDEIVHSFPGPEYAGLVTEEPEEHELDDPKASSPISERHVHYGDEVIHGDTAEWANNVNRHHREFSHSAASDRTLFGARSSHSDDFPDVDFKSPKAKDTLLRWIGQGIFATVERSVVIAAYGEAVLGVVIYTGGCRGNYTNGCLAHLIKGGIFWCYGLLTFARFLGSYADLGWAWNRAPNKEYVSAEFVESLVIFIYGITNTWMERFGAKTGDPYTTKQIQHIGIAVMFWFAGLVGMALESKRVRKWMASSTIAALPSNGSKEAVAEPPSYIASFNPFPALVIGVTGAAMSAHAQTYVFQVQIHMLWGYLLAAFSVLRCLTYFFVWLGPPRSILPSRPPTEALGSFFLACGGLSFQFSTEELTIAAMRRGRDDVMMFMNVAVAMTCLAFTWTICVVGFKGYLKSRLNPQVSYHSSA
ncbi:cytoplasmic protein [Armillaria fumosa]|nr:cytoplasmic protein [Armillaria fumosa]